MLEMNLWQPEIGQHVLYRRSLECPHHVCKACHTLVPIKSHTGIVTGFLDKRATAECRECGHLQVMPGHTVELLLDKPLVARRGTYLSFHVAASELRPIPGED